MDTPKRRRNAPVPRASKPHLKLDKKPRTGRQRGKPYRYWLVYGTGLDGGRIRRKFPTYEAAQRWKSVKEIAMLNGEASLNNVATLLSPTEVKAAEAAIKRLGEGVELGEVVDFYLKHFKEPDKAMRFRPALCRFLADKERGGLRVRTLDQLQNALKRFEDYVGDRCHLHEITTESVEEYLRALRARDGEAPASRKTWNNARAELHSFFAWCSDRRRGWVAENPVSQIERFKIARGVVESLDVRQCRELMAYVESYKGGRLMRYFALALFAGIRPAGELARLATSRNLARLIDLARDVLWVPPEIGKTGEKRRVKIRPNLKEWLLSAPAEILPANHDRDLKHIRQRFGLGHDVLRHTFFSMHVATFKSVGEAALEGGNSEHIVRKHYLDLANYEEGAEFWTIRPTGGGKVLRIA